MKEIDRVSYSSLVDWTFCPYFFRLIHLDGLPKIIEGIYTHWGHLIHRHVQLALVAESDEEIKEVAEEFVRIWSRFCRFWKYEKEKSWATSGSKAIQLLPKLLKEKFGEYKIVQIEERLKSEIPEFPQIFKGFIDIVLETKDKVIILDLKSCTSIYMFNKYRDKYKDYQLTLYKRFWAEKHNIKDLKTIETYFVLMERNPKSKKPIEITRVTSGNKKIENATIWLRKALFAINKGIWIKNKTNCLKYGDKYPCQFHCTSHCK